MASGLESDLNALSRRLLIVRSIVAFVTLAFVVTLFLCLYLLGILLAIVVLITLRCARVARERRDWRRRR